MTTNGDFAPAKPIRCENVIGQHDAIGVDQVLTRSKDQLVRTSRSFHNNLILHEKLERAKGFEPSTPTLARLCSTPELRPLERLRPALVAAGRGEARG